MPFWVRARFDVFSIFQKVSPKFTEHGKKRAAERGITPEEIDRILYEPSVFYMPSKTDEEAAIAYGIAADKLWAIVFNLETGAVITVRLASKKERRFYEQKKGN
jgi:uncharacterized DUF497 family protein